MYPSRNRKQRMRRLLLAALLCLFMFGVGALPASASPAPANTACVTCLGPQTSALWEGYPTFGGFAPFGAPLLKHLRLEVLYIDDGSGALLWSLVKALDAFGSRSGAQPAKQDCRPAPYFCPVPTFDLSHATYRSRYAAFVFVALANSTGHCVQKIPPEAARVLKHEHYRLFRAPRIESEPCWNEPAGMQESSLPMLLVGGYLQVGPDIVTQGDFEGPAPGNALQTSGLPFATVHDTLASNTPTSQISAGALYHVNAEANLIEALICHTDRLQPHSVCGRGVIGKLIKQMH